MLGEEFLAHAKITVSHLAVCGLAGRVTDDLRIQFQHNARMCEHWLFLKPASD